MRINKFVARATGLSRRAADAAITEGRVTVNGRKAGLGDEVAEADRVRLDNQPVTGRSKRLLGMLNKPAGYVCSRTGQGSRTVYDLIPDQYRQLKTVGRLDKESSGLLLMTDDGDLANQLTHPRYSKTKIYHVELDRPLAASDLERLEQGIAVQDYVSRLELMRLKEPNGWQVSLQQGRNRQIRRTFEALGYSVKRLHRTAFGPYRLGGLALGKYKAL